MAKNLQFPIADRLITSDFLFPCRNIWVALRKMKRCGQFTERKPARYWYILLRNLWRDSLRDIAHDETSEETNVAHSPLPRCNHYVALGQEMPHPLNSILNFLLLTLHLSFIREMPVLNRAVALQIRKKGGGLHHVQKMPILRSAQRLQVLSC